MKNLFLIFVLYLVTLYTVAQDKSDWIFGYPDACTSITVGKSASFDGSVMTSHTDDSHRTRSAINMMPAKDYGSNSGMMDIFKRVPIDTFAMPFYGMKKVGQIPQVSHTYAYINSAYPCMNEHQLAIGESTFGGREELQSDSGLIDCTMLCQLILERCTTVRQALMLTDQLLQQYGWIDFGEALTIADPKEVWHLEIVGPGRGKKGAVWVAQRVPDDQVGVNANASTIKEIDLKNKEFFMASKNVFDVAVQNGWWKKENGVFRFCYAYAPESRKSFASRRREWRVFDLIAPSLKLDPNDENYPFSVKPDKKITMEMMVRIFKDYYEGTPFDMTKDMIVKNDSGKAVISPLANPQMPYDANKLFKINGGWGWLGERTIARWYTMYATITQSRDWLPDEIGGKVWLAMDNIATSIYIPVYSNISSLPSYYSTEGRTKGITRQSAWWAFNYLGTLSAHRWGDMRKDVDAVWNPWQTQMFSESKSVEEEALRLYKSGKMEEMKSYLTKYTNDWGIKVVEKAWETGDFLWTKYDEKW